MKGYDMNDDRRAREIVLAVGQINFEGNIIPASWFEHLRYPPTTDKKGKQYSKPNTNAIIILSDIVYWYRPVEVRDPKTGRHLGYRKKFEGPILQRSRGSFEEQFGFSKKQVTDALAFLEEKGIIRRHIRKHMVGKQGQQLGNVLFIELIPEKLREITTPITYREEGYDPEVIDYEPVGNSYAPTSKTNTETTTEITDTESEIPPPDQAQPSRSHPSATTPPSHTHNGTGQPSTAVPSGGVSESDGVVADLSTRNRNIAPARSRRRRAEPGPVGLELARICGINWRTCSWKRYDELMDAEQVLLENDYDAAYLKRWEQKYWLSEKNYRRSTRPYLGQVLDEIDRLEPVPAGGPQEHFQRDPVTGELQRWDGHRWVIYGG